MAASAASAPLSSFEPGRPARSRPCCSSSSVSSAEADGLAGVEGDAREPVRRRSRDVLEVRSPAADDHAERHHGVGTGLEGRLRDDRQLEAAGHAHERVTGAGGIEGAHGAGDADRR